MTRLRFVSAALAVLAGCDPGPAPGVDQPMTGDAIQDLTGTSVVLGGPSLKGCGPSSSLMGAATPDLQGCSNNGPLLASSLAWVSLGSATAASGAAVESVTLQGSRFSGTVNGRPVSGRDFEGARFIGMTTSGRPTRLRLDDVDPGSRGQADVWRYEVSYQDTSGRWRRLCEKDHDEAVVVSGRWDHHQGQPGDGAKVDDPTVFTIGCGRSAIEKCINAGYRPWASAGGVSLDAHHQACVRMMRADYCGDGVSHTTGGRKVNLYDRLGLQEDTREWVKEAEWTTGGARCLSLRNLTVADAPCLSILGTRSCGETSDISADTLVISETPKTGGRDGH